MASSSSSNNSRTKIVEVLVEAGKKAFDPNTDVTSRKAGVKAYEELIAKYVNLPPNFANANPLRTETWALIPALNVLIKPNILPSWLRDPLMQTLTHVPLRPDGVRGTMEFVFSVHPSSSSKSSEPQKQGASITHEAIAVATRLLSSVPTGMPPEEWFGGISGQLLGLMDGDAGADLDRTAAQIVGFGILGRKQYGAPGSAGWNAFVHPLLQNINPSLSKSPSGDSSTIKKEEDEIIDISQDRILVRSEALKTSLQRLSTLILSNPSPGLCKRVLKPILLQIWALASWPSPLSITREQYCKPARNLFQTYLRLFGSTENVLPLIRNLLCKGSLENEELHWKYRLTGKGEIEVVEPRVHDSELELNWNEIEDKSTGFIDLLASSCSKEEMSSVFLSLLRRWIETANKQDDVKMFDTQPSYQTTDSPVQDLIEVTVLQKLMDKAPDKLVSHFDQLLELVCQVFKADEKSQLGDDLVGVVLSLLNLVITAPTFQKSHIKPEELEIVESSLERISHQGRAQMSQTARNLALLLKYRDELDDDKPAAAPSNRQVEDRKTYNLAMNYITGGGDNPPPVVSEGLNLLSNLIVNESPILDITAVTVLLSNLLSENEDYINLRVIKVFTQLANKHPKSAVQELLDHYLDAQEKSSADVRLRFGEALLQVIERLGHTFAGDIAQQTGETLLSIAGRRGYRPKTKAKQVRDERLRKMKKKEPEVAEISDEEEITEEERANNDILAQIIQGWESKRGSEDVRMRASALSIFGTALETNIGGIGPALVSASVDLSINVLAMERELETAILRRAAIMNVLSFVRALDKAKESGRKLGFGLTDESREDILRTLKYVAGTDNDGLVQQHARDVIESLENWQMSSLLSEHSQHIRPELSSLAGLHFNPAGALIDEAGRPRPRIEELE
ncbi:Fc.00g028030.m01.CDS01 [Cosmosporella sp. VM-42]